MGVMDYLSFGVVAVLESTAGLVKKLRITIPAGRGRSA